MYIGVLFGCFSRKIDGPGPSISHKRTPMVVYFSQTQAVDGCLCCFVRPTQPHKTRREGDTSFLKKGGG